MSKGFGRAHGEQRDRFGALTFEEHHSFFWEFGKRLGPVGDLAMVLGAFFGEKGRKIPRDMFAAEVQNRGLRGDQRCEASIRFSRAHACDV